MPAPYASDEDASMRYGARTRIDLNEPSELRYWSDELGCTRERLLDLVESRGVIVSELHGCLMTRGRSSAG